MRNLIRTSLPSECIRKKLNSPNQTIVVRKNEHVESRKNKVLDIWKKACKNQWKLFKKYHKQQFCYQTQLYHSQKVKFGCIESRWMQSKQRFPNKIFVRKRCTLSQFQTKIKMCGRKFEKLLIPATQVFLEVGRLRKRAEWTHLQ